MKKKTNFNYQSYFSGIELYIEGSKRYCIEECIAKQNFEINKRSNMISSSVASVSPPETEKCIGKSSEKTNVPPPKSGRIEK